MRDAVATREAFIEINERLFKGGWIETGTPPTIQPGPIPETPSNSYEQVTRDTYGALKSAVKSGEPDNIPDPIPCGDSPADPANPQGPTISQVIESLR